MRAPAPLRSLQTKLTLLLAAIAGLAVGGVYLYVSPRLRSSLEQQTVRDLERASAVSPGALQAAMVGDILPYRLNELVRAVADSTDARVTLLAVRRRGRGAGFALEVLSDSNVGRRAAHGSAVAQSAVRTGRPASAIAPDRGERVAEVARPLLFRGQADWVVVYSRRLDGVSETVGLVRGRLVVAAAIALLVALVGGHLVARALTRRVRRLEAAARRVAAGEFVEPLPVDAEDELGELTRTFNEMQAQLKRVDQARREFIATASHELRTPIFSLGGFAELLQDEELDPETRNEFVTAMREQVERLQKLAGDLLDLSRLDAGSLELHPEPVDLAELAREVADEFGPALNRHGAQLELRLGDRVEAFCDHQRVAQIVRILLDNALRHTPAGAHVTVTADRADGSARLSVADSGPALTGRRLADASRLFERFYTGDAARGSGLGLAIAKELAERMHGRVAMRAEPRATVFELGLPRSSRDGPARGAAGRSG